MSSSTRVSAAGLLAACSLAAVGCGYGPVSDAAYTHAKELYTLANMKAVGTLDAVEAAIDQKRESGELPPHEADWLVSICEDCRSGDWDDAQAAAKRMMSDQVEW